MHYEITGRLDIAGKKIRELKDMTTKTIQNETKRQKY